ncbi:sulfatase family protein [Marinobacterium rhizophilum]|uniref:Sulfatase-like hydrolase/transferase n=1 Tax=Marinobacterium rhizophilum TaxID=420402 RepID=A0ABY5HJP2_9GAMM|nr:sulfatase-like hydrolase/transferase [Marinobacterium rhizophilum]UTW12600.1 sulfatase-like hydrolase/transferase [Marinobacterium rhizophilum]
MADQPNYLFIITDQHRADHLGCYGNTIVKTPNIDALAATGTRFDRFYVANPICMCNRASILTGRMPSLHGVRHNGIPLSTEATTFVELLRDAGYKTALIGKSHIQNMTGLPASIGYSLDEGMAEPSTRLQEASKHQRKGNPYDQELSKRWRENPQHRVSTPFYGFDEVLIANDHADRVTGDYEVWLQQQCPEADSLRGPENALPDERYNSPQAWRTRIPEELYSTSYIAQKTQEYIQQHAQSGDKAPFFLTMSFPDPHHPFTPPGKYWDMYDPDQIPLPESFGKGDIPPLDAMRQALEEGKNYRNSQDPFMVTAREAQEITALTYGSISMIDDAIGRVMATLKESGLADNTIVCFTSDHGDYMGDHGLMLKLLMHYQGLIRVPFIWHDPTAPRESSTDPRLCSSIDIAPSILRRSHIQPFNGIQGIDILDSTQPQRAGLLIEEDSQRSMVGFDQPQRVRTYLTQRWRLSLRHGESWSELYDLENDPHELCNLWDNPDYQATRAELIEAMMRESIAMQDRSPLPSYRA